MLKTHKKTTTWIILAIVVITSAFIGDVALVGEWGRYVFASLLTVLTFFSLREGYAKTYDDYFLDFRDLISEWMRPILFTTYTAIFLFTSALWADAIALTIAIFLTILILMQIAYSYMEHRLGMKEKEIQIDLAITTFIPTMVLGWMIFDSVAGVPAIMYIILVPVLSDTFGQLGGMMYGKHKITPNISPNKTWEGFLIGIAVSSLISAGWFFGFNLDSYFAFGSFAPVASFFIVLGFTLMFAIVSFFGDLIFSSMKRRMYIKDFSNALPGHGGLLDRIDSHSVVTTLAVVILALVLI